MDYTTRMRGAAWHINTSDAKEACMQCMVRCHEVHRVWSHDNFAACARCTSACNSACNLPFFFKYVTVFMESTYYKPAMEVPFAFAQLHISDAICHVELEGPDGRLWFAKVKHRQKQCLLMQGWREFAASYALARGDALLFQLMTTTSSTKCHFTVKIFKRNPSIASELHDSPNVNISLESHPGQDKGGQENPCLERGIDQENHTKKETIDASKPSERDTELNVDVFKPVLHLMNSEEELAEPHTSLDKPCVDSGASKRQKDHANVHEVIKPNLLLIGNTYVKRKAAVQAMARITNCMNGHKSVLEDNHKLAKQRRGAENEMHSYPSFSKTMFASSVRTPFVINIPRSFSATHMAHTMTKACYDMRLILAPNCAKMKEIRQGTCEGSWPVRCSRNCLGVILLNTGWKEFASMNELKQGDVCVFQLVEPFTFMVHIQTHTKGHLQHPPPLHTQETEHETA